MESQPDLEIQLLGTFRLTYRGQLVRNVLTKRLVALLSYLLIHRYALVSRQQLAFLFWPDTTETQAYSNLRNLIHQLKRSLPVADQFLRVEPQFLQWKSEGPYRLDLDIFELAAAKAESIDELKAAAEVYSGDLLPGFYNDWIQPIRENLRQKYMSLLERLINNLEDERQYTSAITYSFRLLQMDPIREESYLQLMRLHMLNDDRAAALHVYHNCVAALRKELEVDPGRAIQEAYEGLLSHNTQLLLQSLHNRRLLPLVGRKREWGALQRAWRDTSPGKPRLVLVRGEAGIGKTRLVEEMIDWAVHQDISTARASCYAAGQGVAYTPLIDWLRANPLPPLDAIWMSELARLLPALLAENSGIPPPEPMIENWQRLRFFEALARAIIGNRSSAVLVLEDLQWCDQDTLEWLHYLLLRFSSTQLRGTTYRVKVLVIGTLRVEEMISSPIPSLFSSPLEALVADTKRSGQLGEVDLGPLNESETISLASSVAKRELKLTQAASLYRNSEGNPLFVVEMVQAGFSGDWSWIAEPDDQVAVGKPLLLPSKVRNVIEARLAQLTAPAYELACVAAAIGRAFSYPVLAEASHSEPETLVRVLDELWQRRIIRERGPNLYDFSHEKIREVAYSLMTQARLKLVHRRVAEALEKVYASEPDVVSGMLAAHYELAGMLEQAISHFQQAATNASHLYANQEAISYLKSALVLIEQMQSHSVQTGLIEKAVSLLEQLGDILFLTGQHEESRRAYQSALAQPLQLTAPWSARLQRKTANTWQAQRQWDAAETTYLTAEMTLGHFEAEHPPEWWQEWIQIHTDRMLLYYWQNRPQRIDSLVDKVLPHLEHYGTPSQQSGFFRGLTFMRLRRDRYRVSEETLASMGTYLNSAQQATNRSELAYAVFNDGFVHLWYGDHERAEEQMEAALELSKQIGDVIIQARCLTYLAVVARMAGRVQDVHSLAEESQARGEAVNMPEYVATAKANQAWVAFRVGNLEGAESNARAALKIWGSLPAGHASASFQWTALWPLLAVTCVSTRLEEAIDFARLLLDPAQLRLPDLLEALLFSALQAWEQEQGQAALNNLCQAVELAKKMGYL